MVYKNLHCQRGMQPLVYPYLLYAYYATEPRNGTSLTVRLIQNILEIIIYFIMICFVFKESFNTTYNFIYLSKYFE
jgi:hypothetical protein